mmetsp:Transcript_2082/g.2751  ORF Transcript_2082/g.2751 Transcript_2082/m.2751 type:complete len:95 (-) Transcript_2082:3751-4035(-)
MFGRLRSVCASRFLPMTRRGMAGGHKLHKNKHIEEWNHMRENTEKTFEFNSQTVPWIVLWVVIFPGAIHYVIKEDIDNSNRTGLSKSVKDTGTL